LVVWGRLICLPIAFPDVRTAGESRHHIRAASAQFGTQKSGWLGGGDASVGNRIREGRGGRRGDHTSTAPLGAGAGSAALALALALALAAALSRGSTAAR
jgi:hypothetical protein